MNKTLAFVIHHRAYKEHDLIVQLLTERYGLISAVLKGGRSTSKVSQQQRSSLQLATLLEVQLKLSNTSLSQLLQVDNLSVTPPLSAFPFVYVSYINEISRLYLTEGEAVPSVFTCYQQSLLSILGVEDEEKYFRLLELELIKASDLAWSFDVDVSGSSIQNNEYYDLIFDQGMAIIENAEGRGYSGQLLLSLSRGQLGINDRHAAKLLFRQITQHLFPSARLKSRELFLQLKK